MPEEIYFGRKSNLLKGVFIYSLSNSVILLTFAYVGLSGLCEMFVIRGRC